MQIPIAANVSKPIVVRGRSPGYYPENHKLSVPPYGIPSRSNSERPTSEGPPSSGSHQNFTQASSLSYDKPISKYISPLKDPNLLYNSSQIPYNYQQSSQKQEKMVAEFSKSSSLYQNRYNPNSEYDVNAHQEYPFSPHRQNDFNISNRAQFIENPSNIRPTLNQSMENENFQQQSKKGIPPYYNQNIQFYSENSNQNPPPHSSHFL
ncbi:hypothetical protein AYI69_g733 [Smittium culicis]|uniref:Uncharacterized protein n=1 Tax=Smittium culicis TaxID=133412 RepID=A0A1R1YS90_9FUNG|nr:hypothetical protein AYI69_g733 [Smittium culicis]